MDQDSPSVKRITLGEHKVDVVSQRHARLEHGARRFGFGDLGEFYVALALPTTEWQRRYELLCLAIPDLEAKMPLHEWCGYASEDAMKADRYQEASDRSPTEDQVTAAGMAVVEVNGVGRLGKIMGVVQSISSLTQQAQMIEGNSTRPSPASAGATGE